MIFFSRSGDVTVAIIVKSRQNSFDTETPRRNDIPTAHLPLNGLKIEVDHKKVSIQACNDHFAKTRRSARDKLLPVIR
jgi:hypothetical protein